MNRRLAIALCFAGIFVAVAPVAHADWERVTSPSPGTQPGQAALLRTTDGVLHAVWRSDLASYRHRIDHRQIAVDGSLGPVTPVVRDWLELSDPALTVGPDGLRAIFGGLPSSHPDETNTELNTALSVDNGATWGLQDGSIVPAGSGATDA